MKCGVMRTPRMARPTPVCLTLARPMGCRVSGERSPASSEAEAGCGPSLAAVGFSRVAPAFLDTIVFPRDLEKRDAFAVTRPIAAATVRAKATMPTTTRLIREKSNNFINSPLDESKPSGIVFSFSRFRLGFVRPGKHQLDTT